MCIRICPNCLVKCLEKQRIIIVLTERVGHNAPVTEIQNGTQIESVNLGSLIPFELRHVGEPFLVGLCGIKLPAQKIPGKILRVLCLPSAATVVIFHSRAYISGSTDAEHPLIIDMDTVVMAQVIIESSIALVWTFLMDLLNRIRKAFILHSSSTQLTGSPSMVG